MVAVSGGLDWDREKATTAAGFGLRGQVARLDRLNIVARNELIVCIEELNPGLLERALRQQQPLGPRQAYQYEP